MSRSPGSSDVVVVVTSDSHVGPPPEHLRAYCPSALVDDFDGWLGSLPEDRLGALGENHGRGNPLVSAAYAKYILPDYRRNSRTAGHYDVGARLTDMDRDGVACGVIYHASLNGEDVPFMDIRSKLSGLDPSRAAAGMQMFNRWLADFCAVEAERHIGLCQVPMWDIEASIAEVVWAHDHGLKGVNFPAPTSQLKSYEHPAWEPFFATCAERNMVLNTHIGGGEASLYDMYTGPAGIAAYMLENPFLGRRAIWLLTFTGAFERHPNLKLVVTELPGSWWDLTVKDMDSCYLSPQAGVLRESLPRLPSEYVAEHCYMGASFQSRQEAELAVSGGYDHQFMWGSDYPHAEGTWCYPESEDEPSITRLSLANTFHGLPEESVRRMAGENAVGCYGLDRNLLAKVAERIGPSMTDLQTQPDLSLVPEYYRGSGFRTVGAFA